MLRHIRKFASVPTPHNFKQTKLSSVVEPYLKDMKEKVYLYNEPLLSYKMESEERKQLTAALAEIEGNCADIPIVIAGKEFRAQAKWERFQVMPHKHTQTIAKFYYGDYEKITSASVAAAEQQTAWSNMPIGERIRIWQNAAQLISKKHRANLVAAIMLGQAKTVQEAEWDVVQLIDYMHMNSQFLKVLARSDLIAGDHLKALNHMRFHGLRGFVAAICPFNATSIAGNMVYTPALMGNAIVWKPNDFTMLSSWRLFNIMREAGVPDGVINFVPAAALNFGSIITSSLSLAGINFTGSTRTFKMLWQLVAKKLEFYDCFPRLLGECGAKNFHFVHASAHVDSVVAATIRAAFSYAGQNCYACSRLYVPESLWHKEIKESLVEHTKKLIIGDVQDSESSLSAVIDKKSFQYIVDYIEGARLNENTEVIAGGTHSQIYGYFIDPTIIVVKDPKNRILMEEIQGPVLAVYVYKDNEIEKAIEHVNGSFRSYGLAGSVFAQDEEFLKNALIKFQYAAGNLYINDIAMGVIAAQQPFSGGQMSGTNEKPGSLSYLLRWTHQQTVRENFLPISDMANMKHISEAKYIIQ